MLVCCYGTGYRLLCCCGASCWLLWTQAARSSSLCRCGALCSLNWVRGEARHEALDVIDEHARAREEEHAVLLIERDRREDETPAQKKRRSAANLADTHRSRVAIQLRLAIMADSKDHRARLDTAVCGLLRRWPSLF